MSRIRPTKTTKPATQPRQWNKLTTPWLEVMGKEARLPSASLAPRWAHFQELVPPHSAELAAKRAKKSPRL
jgi:hypothetical protein